MEFPNNNFIPSSPFEKLISTYDFTTLSLNQTLVNGLTAEEKLQLKIIQQELLISALRKDHKELIIENYKQQEKLSALESELAELKLKDKYLEVAGEGQLNPKEDKNLQIDANTKNDFDLTMNNLHVSKPAAPSSASVEEGNVASTQSGCRQPPWMGDENREEMEQASRPPIINDDLPAPAEISGPSGGEISTGKAQAEIQEQESKLEATRRTAGLTLEFVLKNLPHMPPNDIIEQIVDEYKAEQDKLQRKFELDLEPYQMANEKEYRRLTKIEESSPVWNKRIRVLARHFRELSKRYNIQTADLRTAWYQEVDSLKLKFAKKIRNYREQEEIEFLVHNLFGEPTPFISAWKLK